MKKLLQNISMLLAAFLLVGGVAQAAVTETYDFATFVSGGAPTLTLGTEGITQEGTNAQTVYLIDNPTNTNSETLDLKERFALNVGPTAGVTLRWMWRSSTNAYQNGLAGNWNGGGTAVTSYNISILDLHAGDKVTINFSIQSGKDAAPKTCSANIISSSAGNMAAEAALTSGTEYTMLVDGRLDLYSINNNMAIQKVTIVSDYVAESVDAPVISVVGANKGNRIVSITGHQTNAGSATTTYYTLDGSNPTTSSTKYVSEFTLTEAEAQNGSVTVKAITVKDDDNSIASEIKEYTVSGIGETITLNVPAITISGFNFNEPIYSPVYSFSSDQSSIIGAPEVTYTYDYAGVQGTSSSVTADKAGKLTVTVSADGYASSSTEIEIENYAFARTYFYDFTSISSHSTTTVASQYNYNGAGCQAYAIDADAIDGLTLNINLLWKITANVSAGLFARAETGTITYNGALPEGSYVVFENDGSPVISTSATTSFSIYGIAKNISVYVPANMTITLPTNTYGTYTPSVNVDFTDNTDVEAYSAVLNAEGTAVVLTQVTAVPAGEGVVLKKISDNATTTVSVVAEAATLSGNQLVGVTEATDAADLAAGTNYVLKSDEFHKVEADATGTIAAGKAYLNVPAAAGARVLAISFGDATAADAVVAEVNAGETVIYNLAGMRVKQPVKGNVYIVNGKAVRF